MRDAILPWAVMAFTILVAVGLMVFFRKLLKMREELAPEVVYPREPEFHEEMSDFVRAVVPEHRTAA
jgi:hypothetical protein